MKTKAQILHDNPSLSLYRVMLAEDRDFQIAFDCYAEDREHALEQAENAYPNGEVFTVTLFEGTT
jgi:1,2-phenylacetyl-CoA epoxidase PaaB subunit